MLQLPHKKPVLLYMTNIIQSIIRRKLQPLLNPPFRLFLLNLVLELRSFCSTKHNFQHSNNIVFSSFIFSNNCGGRGVGPALYRLLLQNNGLGMACTNLHLQRPPNLLTSSPLILHVSQKCLCPWFVTPTHAQLARNRKTIQQI